MARVTVEDCIEKIPNRFDLVLGAAQRSRNISTGNPLTIDRDNDKNPVVALREIAEETVSLDELKESLISNLQNRVEIDEQEDEEMDFLGIQEEIAPTDFEDKTTVAVIGEDNPEKKIELTGSGGILESS